MTRKEIYQEIEGVFGLVPSMFKAVPDSALELEWKLFMRTQMGIDHACEHVRKSQ